MLIALEAKPWWTPTREMAAKDDILWQLPEVYVMHHAGVFKFPYPLNPLFRGRDAELTRLAEALLGEQHRTVAVLPAIEGTGGVGKTQLAIEFAHRHRDAFPGGVFWLNMADPAAVAPQVAAAGGPSGLDLPGSSGLDFEAMVAAVRRAWNEPVRRLLVFDSLEEPQVLRDWRPTDGGAQVLVTTRRGVWVPHGGVQPVPLQALARHESVRLLLTPRHGEQVEIVLADPALAADANAICEQVGDLPLALALAGTYLEQTPDCSLGGYRARLAASLLEQRRVETEPEETVLTHHAQPVAATIALNYHQLDLAETGDHLALRLLQHLAQLALAPIPRRLLVRLADRNPNDERHGAEVDALVRRLAALRLVQVLSEGEVVIHPLIAAFVRHQDVTDQASVAWAAARLSDEVYTIDLLDYSLRGAPYLPHLLHLARHEKHVAATQAALLQQHLGYVLRAQGNFHGARPYYERALAITEQVQGPEHLDTAHGLTSLGSLLQAQGDYHGARPYYERALAITEQVQGSQHLDTIQSLDSLGLLLQVQGDLPGARVHYERALAITEQMHGPQHRDTAQCLRRIGLLLHAQGDLHGARLYYERALAITEQVHGPHHPQTARDLDSLGLLLRGQGDFHGAHLYYERALAIYEQALGRKHPETARSLIHLGLLLQAQGDLDAARLHLERAMAIYSRRFGKQHARTQAVEYILATLDERRESREE